MLVAVKKLVYKHLNSLGFKKYGHTFVKRIGETDYYGFVAIERDTHYWTKERVIIPESDKYYYVGCDKTLYDIRCEVLYIDPSRTQDELAECFKNCDVEFSLCKKFPYKKSELSKGANETDERVVSEIIGFFYEMFYNPVYKNMGRSRIAHDDEVGLYDYVKKLYYGSVAEYLCAGSLCHMAYDEGKYEDAIYYAKMAMVCFRPGQYDYAEALNNFHKVYSTIKLGGWEKGAGIVEIYENSIRKLYNGLTE